MGRKAKKHGQYEDFDSFDEFENGFENDFDIKDLSRDFFSTERDDYYSTNDRFTARRKIERRRDMKKLYSQLDEWEEFGGRSDW